MALTNIFPVLGLIESLRSYKATVKNQPAITDPTKSNESLILKRKYYENLRSLTYQYSVREEELPEIQDQTIALGLSLKIDPYKTAKDIAEALKKRTEETLSRKLGAASYPVITSNKELANVLQEARQLGTELELDKNQIEARITEALKKRTKETFEQKLRSVSYPIGINRTELGKALQEIRQLGIELGFDRNKTEEQIVEALKKRTKEYFVTNEELPGILHEIIASRTTLKASPYKTAKEIAETLKERTQASYDRKLSVISYPIVTSDRELDKELQETRRLGTQLELDQNQIENQIAKALEKRGKASLEHKLSAISYPFVVSDKGLYNALLEIVDLSTELKLDVKETAQKVAKALQTRIKEKNNKF